MPDAAPGRGASDIPLHDYLGLAVLDAGPPARVTVPLTPAIRGAVAPVHGGVFAALADVACAAALGGAYDPAVEFPVSTDLQVRFVGQPRQGPLLAQAEVVHRGSRLLVAECVITDGDGRQLARASGTYLVVRGFGTLGQDAPG